MKKVLITGASGFVGSNLLIALERLNVPIEVYAWGRQLPQHPLLRESDRRKWHQVDLQNENQIRASLDQIRPDVIVHAAASGVDFRFQAPSESQILSCNVIAPVQILSHASRLGLKKFIALGSCLEYGLLKAPALETQPLIPLNIYGATKAAASLLLRERGRELGVPTCVIRLFGMWGAFENFHRLFPQVVHSCRSQKPLALSRGDQRRDYSYVGDVARALALLAVGELEFPRDEILNLASGQIRPMREHILEWASAFKGEHLMKFGELPYRESESTELTADITLSRKFGLAFNSTPLDEALSEVLEIEKPV